MFLESQKNSLHLPPTTATISEKKEKKAWYVSEKHIKLEIWGQKHFLSDS